MNKNLPLTCPSCHERLQVKSLFCEHCETTVTGMYALPVLASLNEEDRNFILEFVKSSGSLKVMAQKLKLSYPTVRNILDDIIQKITDIENR
jgi:hypothetical protein